jgi:hypothetical protein
MAFLHSGENSDDDEKVSEACLRSLRRLAKIRLQEAKSHGEVEEQRRADAIRSLDTSIQLQLERLPRP